MVRHRSVFLAIKWGLYTLLAADLCLFFATAAAFEALDGFGWLLLLAVFEWESTRPDCHRVPSIEKLALRVVQAVGYGLAGYAWWRYWQEGMWADVANAALWLAVVAAMACEMEDPTRFGGKGAAGRNWLKAALLAGLLGMVVWWCATGDWLRACDALLWILCFCVVELNVLGRGARPRPPLGGPVQQRGEVATQGRT